MYHFFTIIKSDLKWTELSSTLHIQEQCGSIFDVTKGVLYQAVDKQAGKRGAWLHANKNLAPPSGHNTTDAGMSRQSDINKEDLFVR